ncbi:hypothetical protein [uncultured Parvimonas sp.]|uniref:hypothetical protein n=1 Tax=uncultured Parvimonas sp. TaxID=747372 RepID=UPI002805FEED|nr:hypothetical protein [uncultured Parvimonas sp.]
MLKEKKLLIVEDSTRYLDRGINIQDAIVFLNNELSKMHYNVEVNSDTVKFGGLFNSTVLDCIVVTNADHKRDYISLVAVFSEDKSRMNVYEMGESKQMKKYNIKTGNEAYRKEVLKTSGMKLSDKIAHNIGNKIVSSIRSIGLNSQKLQDELDYVGYVLHLFEQI